MPDRAGVESVCRTSPTAEAAMIVHLSIHTPRPGKEAELIASMHRYGAAAEGRPGFIDAKTLRDRHTGRLVGMARWKDEASWQEGVWSMRAAVAADPFDEWEAAEVEGFFLEEV
jgi:heme-degrading monooxygenase HmoA